MLHIYTNRHIPEGSRLIFDVAAEYWWIMTRNWGELKKDRTLLRFYTQIDKAELTEELYLKTKFGYISMFECSNETKAAIVAYYYRNRPNVLVNISECGEDTIKFMAGLRKDLYTYNKSRVPVGHSKRAIIFNGELMILREVGDKVYHSIDD